MPCKGQDSAAETCTGPTGSGFYTPLYSAEALPTTGGFSTVPDVCYRCNVVSVTEQLKCAACTFILHEQLERGVMHAGGRASGQQRRTGMATS